MQSSHRAQPSGPARSTSEVPPLGELAERAARLDPDRPALVGLEATLSRREFAERVDRAARLLVGRGLEPGDRVGVAHHKDLDAFVAVHAVLRAGGVVVPIDPMGPAATLVRIADDVAMAGLLLGELAARRFAAVADDLPSVRSPLRIVTDGAGLGAGSGPSVELPEVALDDVAYVIFTSGSTGIPKGIVHTHRSALAYAERAGAHLRTDDRVAGMSPFHFDMSTLELYAAPLVGATVVVMGEAHTRLPASLTERSEREGVTVWYTVPSLLAQVLDRGNLDQHPLGALRSLWFAGEVMAPGVLDTLRRRLPSTDFVNVYGPAEVNECTRWTVPSDHPADEPCPVGSPWDGVELIAVDDDDRPVAPGVAGELWVSAPTVMQGYWGRSRGESDLVDRSEGRPAWYRTGDLVTIDDSGVVRFLGRRDHQVKLRGVRIELESVEAALTDAPGVRHAVAVVADGAEQLDAVIVPSSPGEPPTVAALRRWSAAHLPPVAVPRTFTFVDTLPSTPTGKIDRGAVRRSRPAAPAPSSPGAP